MEKYGYFIETDKKFIQDILKVLNHPDILKLGIIRNDNIKIIPAKSKDTNDYLIPIINDPKILSEFTIEILTQVTKILRELGIEKAKIDNVPILPEYLRKIKPRSFRDVLLEKFPKEIIESIPTSFDIIGSIAITEINRWNELDSLLPTFPETKSLTIDDFKKISGNIILDLHKNITTVLNKGGSIEGEFRVRDYEFIAGNRSTVTQHNENGCSFLVDISKMFFSPRLVFERDRVSNIKFEKKCVIIDCFAGIGPFSIQIAVKHSVTIFSCEKNPDAFGYLEKNIALNKKRITGTIIPYSGDFRELKRFPPIMKNLGKIDYIIMNLPERNLKFIGDLKPYIRKEGTTLIIYLFASDPNPIKKAISELSQVLEAEGLRIKNLLNTRIVKNYSPKIYTVVIDSVITFI